VWLKVFQKLCFYSFSTMLEDGYHLWILWNFNICFFARKSSKWMHLIFEVQDKRFRRVKWVFEESIYQRLELYTRNIEVKPINYFACLEIWWDYVVILEGLIKLIWGFYKSSIINSSKKNFSNLDTLELIFFAFYFKRITRDDCLLWRLWVQ